MKFFDNFSVNVKLLALVLLSLAILAGASFWLLDRQRQTMVDDRMDKVRAVVDGAITIAEGLDKQVQAGKMTREAAMAQFAQTANSIWFDNHTNYILGYTMKGVILINGAQPQLAGQDRTGVKDSTGKLFTLDFIETAKRGGGIVSYLYAKPGQTEPLLKLTYVKPYPAWDMFMGSGVWVDDIDLAFRQQILEAAALLGPLALLMIAGAALIGRRITRPLAALRNRMAELAAGNLDVVIPGIGRGDEVGAMARSVAVFKEAALEREQLMGQQERLKAESEQRRRGELMAFASEFQQEVESVVRAVTNAGQDMRSSSENLSSVANHAQDKAVMVASATEQTAANVQTVAAASEQLTSSIAEIARQTESARKISDSAVEAARATDTLMQTLDAAAREVGSVVGLINSVANQTNLLALNATIEAARAGEAGKGFAVVASEVKNLASQTARATGQIDAQVEQMLRVAGEAVAAIARIQSIIGDVNDTATTISAAVEEQSAATREIVRNIEETAGGIESVSQNISDVSRTATETRDAASSVHGAAVELSDQSARLSSKVDKFLDRLRAA